MGCSVAGADLYSTPSTLLASTHSPQARRRETPFTPEVELAGASFLPLRKHMAAAVWSSTSSAVDKPFHAHHSFGFLNQASAKIVWTVGMQRTLRGVGLRTHQLTT